MVPAYVCAVVGAVLIVVAGWLVAPWLGLAVAGLGLLWLARSLLLETEVKPS